MEFWIHRADGENRFHRPQILPGREKKILRLKIPNRTSSTQMLSDVHPEGKDHVDNYWWTKSQKGSVDEPQPDWGGGNTHFFTEAGTNTKGVLLKKILNQDGERSESVAKGNRHNSRWRYDKYNNGIKFQSDGKQSSWWVGRIWPPGDAIVSLKGRKNLVLML